MLTLISPAKKLDFDNPPKFKSHTKGVFLNESQELINQIKKLSAKEISGLMKLSDPLAQLNVARYKSFKLPFSSKNAKQAIYAFRGDVYQGFGADELNEKQMNFTQKNVRILSGLYGLLKPLDLMQAYRLEMGTKFQSTSGKDLYQFWGNKITEAINADLKKETKPVLLNLASSEYFKAVKKNNINAQIINPVFKDKKNDDYKIISFFAKRARGLMVRYIVDHEINDVESIKGFDYAGYKYNKKMSEGDNWVFTRDTSG